jgi:hypothetical protein
VEALICSSDYPILWLYMFQVLRLATPGWNVRERSTFILPTLCSGHVGNSKDLSRLNLAGITSTNPPDYFYTGFPAYYVFRYLQPHYMQLSSNTLHSLEEGLFNYAIGLCGLVVRVPGYRSRGPRSSPGVHSASWVQLRSYLEEKLAAPV